MGTRDLLLAKDQWLQRYRADRLQHEVFELTPEDVREFGDTVFGEPEHGGVRAASSRMLGGRPPPEGLSRAEARFGLMVGLLVLGLLDAIGTYGKRSDFYYEATTWVTVDGVMQGLGGPDEDRSDDVERGGSREQSRALCSTRELDLPSTGNSMLCVMGESPAHDGWSRYLLLIAAVVVVAVAGFVGYVLYPRFELPAVEGAGLLGLAAAAGVASFFSPCSFPLLVTLLARQAVADTESARPARPAVFGGSLALGASAFMLLAGLVIAFGGETLFAGVTFTSTAGVVIRVVVGSLLIFLGLIQVGILPLSMHAVGGLAQPLLKKQARLRRDRPVMGFAVFGFGYVLAGFG